jgi:hypothetical protein
MNARRLAALLVLSSMLVPQLAVAQGSDADTATARELTRAGYAELDKKAYQAAADLFARADALHHAPTVSLGLARARAALGKLVSAQELYSLVVHEVLPSGASAAFVQAHEDAQRELDALSPRVPSVVIQVTGPAAPKVSVDGDDVPRMALGVRRPVDPGKHVVKAVAPGFYPREATFVVAEGGAENVTLELKPDGTPQVVAPPPSTGPGPVAPPPAPPLVDARTRRLLGLVGLGVGGAGIVMGAVAGAVAVSKHGQLASACPAGRCVIGVAGSDALPGEVSSYKTAGLVATTGLIAGGVLGVAGAVLFATAPRSAAVTLTPAVGLGYVGAQGSF